MMFFLPRVTARSPLQWGPAIVRLFRDWADRMPIFLGAPDTLHFAHLAHLPAPPSLVHGSPGQAAAGVSLASAGGRGDTPAQTTALTGEGQNGDSYHIPVLEIEVTEALAPAPGKLMLDGTLGGGGHTRKLLAGGASVVALDQDPAAVAWAEERLSDAADHLVLLRANFASFPDILKEAGLGPVLDGILLDLGVSSHQLDVPERGFSFMRDGPLDMRMDPDAPLCAADLVNGWPEEELARIFYEYGDEKASRRVARAIVQRRAERRFETTMDLAAVIGTVIPRRGPASPATRVFQALRIAVNDEMAVLESALTQAHLWLKPGGRLAVITFHSLEDRIVKQFFRRHSDAEIDRPEWPAARPNPDCYYRLVTRKGIAAGAAEMSRNPRSRSAHLRVVERLG